MHLTALLVIMQYYQKSSKIINLLHLLKIYFNPYQIQSFVNSVISYQMIIYINDGNHFLAHAGMKLANLTLYGKFWIHEFKP